MLKRTLPAVLFASFLLAGLAARAHSAVGLTVDGGPVSFGSLDVNSTSDPKFITLHPYSTSDWTMSVAAPVLTNSLEYTISQNQFVYWWESDMPGVRTPSAKWEQVPVPVSGTQVYSSVSGECSSPGACSYVMGFKVYLGFQAAGSYTTTIHITILNND